MLANLDHLNFDLSGAKEPTPPQLLSTVSIMSPMPPVSNPASRTVSPASGIRMDLPDPSSKYWVIEGEEDR